MRSASPPRERGPDSSCLEGLCVSRALPELMVSEWGSGQVCCGAGGPRPGRGQGQALPRPLASACGRPSCPCVLTGSSSVRAYAPVSPSSKDTRARPRDRTSPRSPLHTPPRLPHVVTLQGPGVGTPTKESGGTEWCLHIVSTSCKLELLLFLSVAPTFSQVASTDTCPNCRGLPAPGGLPHARRGPLGVCPGHVTPRGTCPRTPAWRAFLIKNTVTAPSSGCFCRVPRGPAPLGSTN